ncbi:MAG TPA: BadF/BadG/BcrA/BcrD ATPase family protein, partial [Candidatus Wallbacteria bacterium]|nr:BadF/BadG/BcrA/BcrD ATPase family protein [Candidatus Wallbacteria bacterium]
GFSMNDKCAAGSGRYLENMAGILKVPLEKLSQCHCDPVALSITCATFGETEVICKLMEGVEVERILAGVNYTVYARVEPMLNEHRSPSGTLVVTSGIAHNAAFIEILKKEAGFKKIIVPDHPQWMGAMGACILGFSGIN